MIQVVNRSLDILELISTDRSRPYTLNEIAGQLNLNKATCANIIKTLVNRGYLEQEGRMTGYRLGSMAYLLTGNYHYKNELLVAAMEPMNLLSEELNESCILSILKENMRLILHEVKCTHELQVVNIKEKEIYRTSTGRMILACLDKKEQKTLIQKYGLPSSDIWPDIEDEDDLAIELHKIKKKQMAEQVSKAHIVGVAVPIYKGKKVIASLGLYLPETRYTSPMQKKILSSLRKTGDIINEKLNNRKEIYGDENN
ncbi:IclR family transcriptional regulator [Mariniphaga sediminis]|jgi:DNA-binding IclR family transcriptional regulator|uniref:IclR family transcriptional regulator n=1 Tax=Mariniphaga sediminis TaxID=1628158 RepID=A0A399D3V0_9BACT|nr:IclR family transcriptional regulator C-terminal domain-containing protein [Mariniphaga sediminis]RIH65401.1 IclR family transcriptional regulator [Mariniphaga sediminis]